MRVAVIENGKVVNVIEAEEDFQPEGMTLVPSDAAQIGWDYNGKKFSNPNPPEEVERNPAPVALTEIILKNPDPNITGLVRVYLDSENKMVSEPIEG